MQHVAMAFVLKNGNRRKEMIDRDSDSPPVCFCFRQSVATFRPSHFSTKARMHTVFHAFTDILSLKEQIVNSLSFELNPRNTHSHKNHGITSTRCYGVTPRRPCARCSEAQWSRDPVANMFARRSIRNHCVVTQRRVMSSSSLLSVLLN